MTGVPWLHRMFLKMGQIMRHHSEKIDPDHMCLLYGFHYIYLGIYWNFLIYYLKTVDINAYIMIS